MHIDPHLTPHRQATFGRLAAAFALSLAGAPFLWAQTAATPSPAAAQAASPGAPAPDIGGGDGNSTVVLSPFEVSATSETGYSASDTLAGNRLRTNLSDVGSAISVYSAKFLQDTAATRATDLLVYTTSGEVGGINGNFSATLNKGQFFDDTGSGLYVSPTGNTRVRGLSNADVTRGYFLTDIQFDAYNTDRIDIQRGANSILFGLASPGGVINQGLNQAQFTDGGNVSTRLDQYGSFRASLDYNRVLIPKQLAFRVDLLNDESKYEQKEAWRHDKRFYMVGRYEPEVLNRNGMSTVIRGNFEAGSVTGADPVVLPPRDQMTTWWTVAHQARNVPAGTYNPTTGKWTGYNNAALGYVDAGNYETDSAGNILPANPVWLGNPGRYQENMAAVFLQPNSSVQGGAGVPAWMQHFAAPTLAGENGNHYEDWLGITTGANIFGALNKQPGFWKDPTFSDPSIFDFYHHTLAGPNRDNNQNFHAIDLSASQTYFDNTLGLEFVFDYQRVDALQENAFTWEDGNAIDIDINTTLPNGVPDPNFGRPFVASDYVDNYLDFQKRRAERLTGFYDLHFDKYIGNKTLAALLGRHTFTGMWSNQYDDHKALRYSRSILAGDIMAEINQVGNPWNWGQSAGLHFLGSSLATASSPSGAHLSGLTAIQVPQSGYTGLFYNPNTHSWNTTQQIGVINDPYYSTFGAGWTKQTVDSRAFVWQGHMLDDVVVPMIGWRHDVAKAYQAVNPPTDPNTGFAILNPSMWYLNGTPANTITGNNTSYSLVVHTPSFIKRSLPAGMEVDLTYNRSQNFEPSAGGQDVYGNPYPAQTGQTKDYGVTLAFLDRRIQFRAIKFDANAQNAQSGDLNTYWVVQTEVNYWNAAHNPYNVINHPDAVAAYLAHQIPQSVMTTWNWTQTTSPSGVVTAQASRTAGYIYDLADTLSKGYEFEVQGTPVKGWDVLFNASKITAIEANNLKDLAGYMADRLPVWTGLAGQMVSGAGAPTNLLQDAQANLIIPYQTGLAKNGMAQQELHKWRWNVVSNYTFHSSPLQGVSVGGAIRYQDPVAIGYGVKTAAAGNLVYDLSKPYYGQSEVNYDLWLGYARNLTEKIRWKVQLNAHNVFQHNHLIPVAAQPDGSVATWRIAPETTYYLTNTFAF